MITFLLYYNRYETALGKFLLGARVNLSVSAFLEVWFGLREMKLRVCAIYQEVVVWPCGGSNTRYVSL